jgi:hypothetical protein
LTCWSNYCIRYSHVPFRIALTAPASLLIFSHAFFFCTLQTRRPFLSLHRPWSVHHLLTYKYCRDVPVVPNLNLLGISKNS